MTELAEPGRFLSALVVSRAGRLEGTGDEREPYRLIGTDGRVAEPVEEALELTHLSIRQYQRPNGEVIAPLVVAPSKSDRERVIPMSAELFAVVAAIVRRHTASGETSPLLPRYDPKERRSSPPMPFLFQRTIRTKHEVISDTTIQHGRDLLGLPARPAHLVAPACRHHPLLARHPGPCSRGGAADQGAAGPGQTGH